MKLMSKYLIVMYGLFAMITYSVVLEACSTIEIEEAVKPMAQPLMAAPIKTSTVNYIAVEPKIVTDASGNSTSVWEEFDGTRFNIWTKRRIAGESWDLASLLETTNTADAHSPQIAIDGIGNITAVWLQSDGDRFGIYVNRFLIGSGWEGATQIRDGAMSQISIDKPAVTYDATGYAKVAWQESSGLNSKTWVKRHMGDAVWGATTQLAAITVGSGSPKFEQNAIGLVAVVSEKPIQKIR
jgi:hypothetical protein